MATRRRSQRVAHTTHITWPSTADIDEDLRRSFIGDVSKAAESGDVVIVHHRAGSKSGRAELTAQLRQWGLAPSVAAVLGWSTIDPTKLPVTHRQPAKSQEPAPDPERLMDDFESEVA